MVTFLGVLWVSYYKWKRSLENSIRSFSQIKLRTCGRRLRTCALCQKMEISDRQTYRNIKAVWEGLSAVRYRKFLKNMHMVKPYKIPCNLSDDDNAFQWKFVHIEALWQSVSFVACRQLQMNLHECRGCLRENKICELLANICSNSMHIETVWRSVLSVKCW